MALGVGTVKFRHWGIGPCDRFARSPRDSAEIFVMRGCGALAPCHAAFRCSCPNIRGQSELHALSFFVLSSVSGQRGHAIGTMNVLLRTADQSRRVTRSERTQGRIDTEILSSLFLKVLQ